MTILHLDSGREMRGGQWQALRLHQALLGAGHQSFLLAREDSPLLTKASELGLPCDALRPLRLAIRSRNFDLVHAHDAHSHTSAAALSRTPFVVSRRVAFPLRKSFASRLKYKRARRYLAVSRYVAGILIDAGIDAARIDVVYDGVEMPAAASAGQNFITPYTDDPAKGMALAAEAAKLAGLPLICSKDLERDLPSARAMIYLTQSEGLGSAILLAMAYGVTVIASNTGGIPELIEDGVNGVLVPNDAKSIAEVLRCLDPARCAEMGRAARESVRERFTVTHMLNATLASYQKALND
jgi:glycosyltransferase involved in cell wall biosynthesis